MTKLQKEPRLIPPSLQQRFDLLSLGEDSLTEVFESIPNIDFTDYRIELCDIPQIDLHEDPTAVGISILNEKLAQVTSFKNRVSTIKLDILVVKSDLTGLNNKVDRAYNFSLNSAMLDEETKKLKNVTIQKASAEQSIPDWLLKLYYDVKDRIYEIDMFLKELDCKYEELENVNANLSRQVTVCQQEIYLMGK